MATKKIHVCDECLSEEFATLNSGLVECKNCKTKYKYDKKKKDWVVAREEPDAKGFINEATS